MLALEYRVQETSVLVSLIKRGQSLGIETLVLVVSPSLDPIIVYSDSPVWVAHCDIDSKVVTQGVVNVEVELVERDVSHMELDLVGAEDEPEDENCKANNDDKGDYDFQQ